MAKKEDKDKVITPKEKLKKLLQESIYHRVVALLENKDLKQMGIEEFTEEQEQTLYNSIKTEKQKQEANVYLSIYNAILQYGKLLIGYKDRYKAEAAKLTGLINVYETQLKVAEKLSNGIKSGAMRVEHSAEDDKEKPFILYLERVDIAIYADGRTNVLIDGEGGFYEEMQKQSKRVAEALSVYKSYLEVLSDYLHSDQRPPIWALCPRSIETLMEYPDYLPEEQEEEKKRYFRYSLNRKRKQGETITPDMEKWALYPDYKEVEEKSSDTKMANNILTKFLEQWGIERNE